jgi:GntR family transcriptional regulator/MocR family aminotransferase
MSFDWSTSAAVSEPPLASIAGVDLHLELAGPGGRSAAIEDALRDAIRGGRLPPGMALPSSRALAKDLAVARGTVTEAYDQLIAEGWLVARRGSGTSVAWTAEHQARRPGGRRRQDGSAPPRHDFRPGNPDVSAFPRQEWIAATRKALRSAPDEALRYGDTRGLAVTREALAGYVARARGVRADPSRMVVCAGFVQALALLADAFRAQGVHAVAMENPSMGAYRAILTKAGFALHLLTVDPAGADPVPLDRAGEVGATFLTPAHQYPSGATLAPARRAAFTAWARVHRSFLVEDDYDGEFRYDRQPVGALQGMDPERIVYVGTASKSLAPGVRLGWMVLPPALVEPVVDAKQLADRQSGAIEQLALAELIESGAFDRHIRRSRLRYRRRRDLLLAALAPVPGVRTQGIAAGLHAVVELPADGPAEGEVLSALAADGVAVHGLSPYWHRSGPRPRGIVVGFATPPEHAFRAAVDALGAGLARLYR